VKPANEIKVLIVEDDPYFTRILQKRLSAEGYQVLSAADGRAGMRLIVQDEPDLVISDWMMPEVDGLELCQSVKTGLREAAPYFILLTAKGEVSDKLLALETGADDYLVKPCDQIELLARVRAGLRIVTLTQTLRRNLAELRGQPLKPAKPAPAEPAGPAPPRLTLPATSAPAVDTTPVKLCEHCHRVAGPDGHWRSFEQYLREVLGRRVEPGSCPDCNRRDHAA
jgi:CheY-like chemotaxis protein